MTIAALIGAVLTIAGQLLSEYLKTAPERKRKSDALIDRSRTELDAGVQRVRDQYPPMQP